MFHSFISQLIVNGHNIVSGPNVQKRAEEVKKHLTEQYCKNPSTGERNAKGMKQKLKPAMKMNVQVWLTTLLKLILASFIIRSFRFS
jgi:hypothetical protein